jgi:hypothetical protein
MHFYREALKAAPMIVVSALSAIQRHGPPEHGSNGTSA